MHVKTLRDHTRLDIHNFVYSTYTGCTVGLDGIHACSDLEFTMQLIKCMLVLAVCVRHAMGRG